MMNIQSRPAPPEVVRNRRLKISPGGIITLPVAARKSLGMKKGCGARLSVTVQEGAVILARAGDAGGFRVSPGGQFELRGDARNLLDSGEARHYWIQLNDKEGIILLWPWR